jgi:hypothetical protein
MGSMMRFSSNFSIPTTRISRRSSTRLSLSKTRSMRWRKMARGKHHSRDSLREATPNFACLSQGLSIETRVWFAHQCMDNVLHSISNDQTFRHSARTSRCRSLSHRLIDPVRNNRLARTYSKALAQSAQGSHNGKAFFKCGLTGHFAWQCPTRQAVPGAKNQNKPQG